MAKGGFKGFGSFAGSGADSTLVGAAFSAAMAGVPKDYTKIFNNISSLYHTFDILYNTFIMRYL